MGPQSHLCLGAASRPTRQLHRAVLAPVKTVTHLLWNVRFAACPKPRRFHHEAPEEVAQGITGGRHHGNRQKWFAMRFNGSNADVNIVTERAEFDAWKWVRPKELPEMVVPFMRGLYLDILGEFLEF